MMDDMETEPLIDPPGKEHGAMRRRGLMMVLSAPSGAGKTSISRALLAEEDNLSLSISSTTREARKGEEDGVHYHFLSEEDFDARVNRGDFLEYAEVFGNQYGTLRDPVEAALSNGRDVLFDIDWQGTHQLTEKAADDIVSIFILPPTAEELENRLKKRGTDSDKVISARMAKAMGEISHYYEYDYVIINVDLKESVQRVHEILHAERMKRRRLLGMEEFVKTLEDNLVKFQK